MSDSIALFDASHGNLASSAGVLSETTLTAGYVAMMKQKNERDDYLNVPPRFLIVAPEYATTAKKLVAAISPEVYTNVNPFSGELTPIGSAKTFINQQWQSLVPISFSCIDRYDRACIFAKMRAA